MKSLKLKRVSTPEQKKNELSLPAQGNRIDRYCREMQLADWKEFEFARVSHLGNC